jgi:glutamate decarboxylase
LWQRGELTRQSRTDYPLPPNEEKTEILRVVVRESMSLDLLERLISDICSVTEVIMNSATTDLGAWQTTQTSVEKEHGSKGLDRKNAHKAERPMDDGVHRAVC